ncbi:Detected protein of unknown function [Hibiscus syriacus]|uniref:RING-type domain-containing protein n=1 Tax=Hibiscus syriacus TaxID=106335 RepID=A0A6A2Y1E2_HIBSY|nr:Detected protein of unknown function [Hibiscus syriacus]
MVVVMAVQAHLYPENLSLSLPMYGLQDCMSIPAPFDPDFCHPPQQMMVPPHLDPNAQNFSSSSSSMCDGFLSMALSKSLDAQLEALHLMRRKEEDLARATKKTLELEACLKKVEMESESWERLAKANEAMALDLSNAVAQVKKGIIMVSNAGEDAESLCVSSCDDKQEGKEDSSKKIACPCKHYNSRTSCVLFLPCRHLCSCMSCEAFLDSCPVCKAAKEASMKVFWV